MSSQVLQSSFMWPKSHDAGVVMAGGSLHKCLNSNLNIEDISANSDLDLWIYGKTLDDRIKMFDDVLRFLIKDEN